MSSDLLRQNGVRSQIPFWRIFTFEEVKSASDYIICDSCVSYAGTNWFGDTLLGFHKKPEFCHPAVTRLVIYIIPHK